jgi:alkylated DNA repair dioxygenase AlkB
MSGSLFNEEEMQAMDRRAHPADHPFQCYMQHFGVVLSTAEADVLFQQLLNDTPWARRKMLLHGKEVEMPRDIAWYGVARGQGVYGHDALDWPPYLLQTLALVERLSGYTYNGCLCNLYRDGNDSVAWHSDREAYCGAVASLSLGATRVFRVRSKQDHAITHDFPLVSGSLLVMLPGCQEHTEHTVPKTKRPVRMRINLTFRQVAE